MLSLCLSADRMTAALSPHSSTTTPVALPATAKTANQQLLTRQRPSASIAMPKATQQRPVAKPRAKPAAQQPRATASVATRKPARGGPAAAEAAAVRAAENDDEEEEEEEEVAVDDEEEEEQQSAEDGEAQEDGAASGDDNDAEEAGEEEEEAAEEEGQEDGEDAEDEDAEDDEELSAEDARLAAEEEEAERAAQAGAGLDGDEEGEEDGLSELPAQSKSPHALTLDATTSAAYTEAMERRGVVYISRIPPYMKAAKLRWMLEQMIPRTKKHGRIGRIFLTPEDASFARKRKKAGGNTGKKFVDGWVEFESKKVARWIAETFNTQPMGGPKRSRYVEDLWTLKYLSGFKWSHLTEKIAYEKQIRGTKIREEMSQAKRDSEHYLGQVDRSRKIESQQERGQGNNKRKRADDGGDATEHKAQRTFHQRTLLDRKPAAAAK